MYSLKFIKRLREEHNYLILNYLNQKHGRIKQAIYKETKMSKFVVDLALVSLYERGHVDMLEMRKFNSSLVNIIYISTESGKLWLKKMKSTLG